MRGPPASRLLRIGPQGTIDLYAVAFGERAVEGNRRGEDADPGKAALQLRKVSRQVARLNCISHGCTLGEAHFAQRRAVRERIDHRHGDQDGAPIKPSARRTKASTMVFAICPNTGPTRRSSMALLNS